MTHGADVHNLWSRAGPPRHGVRLEERSAVLLITASLSSRMARLYAATVSLLSLTAAAAMAAGALPPIHGSATDRFLYDATGR